MIMMLCLFAVYLGNNMQKFKNILFVSYGLASEEAALKTAIATTNANDAHLKIVTFMPEFPGNLKEYEKAYHDALLENIQQRVKKASENTPLAKTINDRVTFILMSNNELAIIVIRMVLREQIDLVIKPTEPMQSNESLSAIEMSLLRKCPCPVWICKPDANVPLQRIAVTVEPNNTDPVRTKLTQELLHLADEIAQNNNAQLTVISTWDCPIEQMMYDSNYFSLPQEVLDLANREIPIEKYNDPRSLSSIVYGYIVAGQEQKGLKLAEQLKKDIFQEYDYYLSLDKKEQRYVKKQMATQPVLYSLVVGAVCDAYNKVGQKDKGYNYLVKSIDPIDKRFNDFISSLKMLGKEKAYKEAENVRKVTPFYTYLFEIMKPYDSTNPKEKESQITTQIMQATE